MMHDNFHDPADELLADSLGGLAREKAPPPRLEESTVASLRRAGVLRSKSRMLFNVANWALAAGIAAAAFVGGSVFATRFRQTPAPEQPTFALLLYGTEPHDDSLAKVARAAEYSQWANGVHAAGRVVGGEALGTPVAALAVRVVGRGEDSLIVAEDSTGSGDFIGYFLVTAPDRNAAVQIARNCPHLKYGGRVIVRRISTGEALAMGPGKP
jgi:hypothetical protein